ncbi:trigger factor [Succinimonas amylolytica]|jgi:trigger factor|uniref:trigger factor n=1 Tax=Succinimonas amylolytica TaxID=83769 RepID=UPI0003662E53|nr:trigger factor [Succinimonas amylolytica]
MQVSIEASEGLNRQLKVTIPSEDYKKARQKEFVMISRNRKFPGFRSGHVPANIIERDYGAEIAERTLSSLINKSVYPAMVQSKIANIEGDSIPVVGNITNNGPDQDLVYTLDIEVKPEVNLEKDLATVDVEKVEGEIGDADLEQMITNLRRQSGKWVENADKVAAKDDRVELTYEGFIDGNAFEGGKASGYPLILGAGRMIPGFEDQIIGHKAGDEFDINVTFPEDYGNKDLAGKAAVFKSKLEKVSENQLPELDEKFISFYSDTAKTEEEFRAEVRKNMERELSKLVNGANVKTVIEKLVSEFGGFEVPSRLVSQHVSNAKKEYEKRNRSLPADEVIENNVKRGLTTRYVIDAFVSKYGIKLDQKAVESYIDMIASAYDSSEEYKKAVMNNKQMYSQFADLSFQKQIADFFFEHAKLNVIKKSFTELVGQNLV